MNNKEWETFGYNSSEPCKVCGKYGDNKSEPRFGYVVCREHAEMSPVEISNIKDEIVTTYMLGFIEDGKRIFLSFSQYSKCEVEVNTAHIDEAFHFYTLNKATDAYYGIIGMDGEDERFWEYDLHKDVKKNLDKIEILEVKHYIKAV